ncbi:MAG: Flp family type IVb pilin [bacterium]|nr:Flp family type IVb pilin [bacterium]
MRRQLSNAFHRLLVDESGPTAVEYAVMLALIIGVCLVSVQALATGTGASFDTSANAINAAL